MAIYYYRVAEQPAYAQVFENHEPFQSLNTESFNVYFCISFALRNYARMLTHDLPLYYSSQSVSCEGFFREGPSFLRSNLSHPIVPPNILEELIPTMMSDAQYFYDKYHRAHVGDPSSAAYPLAVDILVEVEGTIDEEDIEERIILESMQDQVIRTFPASEEAIQSLNTVKLNKDNVSDHQCSICLEQFDPDAEVSTMPCHHLYHKNCLIQWLKISNSCPLCRYHMPVILDNNS